MTDPCAHDGFVERFHQEYDRHVWQDTHLDSLETVTYYGEHFFKQYVTSGHHSKLDGQTPQAIHHTISTKKVATTLHLLKEKRRLTSGKVHFIRHVRRCEGYSVSSQKPVVETPGTQRELANRSG